MRSTAVSTAYSLSRLSGAILPFISVAALDHLGPTAVFLGSAAVLTVVALDVGVLGPRSTGMNLETASDEVAGTAPRPVDPGPRFSREEPRTVAPPARAEELAEPRGR
jgi:putative MFS transporter